MKNQRGLALTSLIFWGIVLAAVVMLAVKVLPDVLDFYKIKKSVQSTALNSSGKTVSEIRSIYGKYAEVEGSPNTTVTPIKDATQVVEVTCIGTACKRVGEWKSMPIATATN